MTAIDEGLSEGSFGSLSIDDEGMEPEKSILIKDGILKKFLSDRAGELRTGHKEPGVVEGKLFIRCCIKNEKHLYS